MSRSITVTIKTAVADTLDRHMEVAKKGLPPGVRVSKSNYVSTSIEAALIRDGYEITRDVADQFATEPIVKPVVATRAPETTNPYEPL